MKRLLQLLAMVAIIAVFGGQASAWAPLALDFSESQCEVIGSNSIKLRNVAFPDYPDVSHLRVWAVFEWDANNIEFINTAADFESGFFSKVDIPQTGQKIQYGPFDDGALQKGKAWANPRFWIGQSLNIFPVSVQPQFVVWPSPGIEDGTVTDNFTDLIWLKDANCTETVGGVTKQRGALTWEQALTWVNHLGDGFCGLRDGSQPGDWYLPNRRQLESLLDIGQHDPALPSNHPFSNVQSSNYWTSSTFAQDSSYAWFAYFSFGEINIAFKSSAYYVWPVRNK